LQIITLTSAFDTKGDTRSRVAIPSLYIQQFCVKELTVNIQSSECQIHTWRVAGFRTLPQMYPSRQKWTAEDYKLDKPITKDIVDGVTHELTPSDVENDLNCITKSTCIVTSNVDRAIINAEAAMSANVIMYPFCDGNGN
jgi:hypothetical protein